MIAQAEVHWNLNDNCTMGCEYCPSRYSGNTVHRGVEDYIRVVRKLQESRYKNAESIRWKLGGGEPLQFPGLGIMLTEIKKFPSYVRIDTSGGESWFDLLAIQDRVDHIRFTHHAWQNVSVLNFAIDFCKDYDKRLSVIVPLQPGKIKECREHIEELKSQGVETAEKILTNDARGGNDLWFGYSDKDKNIINGLPEDYVAPPPKPVDPNAVDPNWKDTSIVATPQFVYTGKKCYAGVDYIFIGQRGFASASDCGGRDLGNVFAADWQAPDAAFNCNMNWCWSGADRKRLRIDQ